MNTWAGKLLGGLSLAALISFNASATTYFVNASNLFPVLPYTNWVTAARNIQSAVDIANAPGDMVLVTNGTYESGGVFYITQTNRLLVTNPIVVKSVNGSENTFIYGKSYGYWFPGPGAIRCVYLGPGAVLDGFTVGYGATKEQASGGIPLIQQAGGGIYCESSSCIVTNCLIAGNYGGIGAGVYGGTLYNCRISFNHGSGVAGGVVNRSVIHNNEQDFSVNGGSLNNCLVVSNIAGGVINAIVNNSTVVSNYSSGAISGIADSLVTNCIVYFNSGNGPHPNFGASLYPQLALRLKNCCTTPSPATADSFNNYSGGGNITNSPAFVIFSAGNYHLQSNSPCINAGINSTMNDATDFDGNPRIVGGTVDIGAYEFQSPASTLSYAWAQQYGLPTDGSVDYADNDGDAVSNYGEWKSGTIPTNSASVLQLASPAFTNGPNGVKVTWQSVIRITYYLQRSSDLAGGFTSIVSNLVGQVGSTSYTDTTATNNGPYFYRVGVQ